MVRVGFVTCVQLGLSCMEQIYQVGGRLDIVLTLVDDINGHKSGRVHLDSFCNSYGIPLVKVHNINAESSINTIEEHNLDWLFIIGWSQIAGEKVLGSSKRGVLGMHPTLLPQGRGRAAIPWAILKGLDYTGVTLFKLDTGVDTGPIIDQYKVTIRAYETATTLYKKVCEAHQTLIIDNWNNIINDKVTFRVQDETSASVWPTRRPRDGIITADMTVGYVERLVRAVTRPYPGAFLLIGERKVRIWAGTVKCPIGQHNVFSVELIDGTYYATDFEIVNVHPYGNDLDQGS